MATIELCPTSPDLLHALWPTFAEVIAAGDTYVQDERMTEPEFATYWCGRGGEQWVATRHGEVVGGYTLRANSPGRGAHVATASYVVARSARGLGIGRRMGEHSIERAGALGFAALQFNFVVSTNAAAVRLWEQLGFRVLARLPGTFQHAALGRVDSLIMFRELE